MSNEVQQNNEEAPLFNGGLAEFLKQKKEEMLQARQAEFASLRFQARGYLIFSLIYIGVCAYVGFVGLEIASTVLAGVGFGFAALGLISMALAAWRMQHLNRLEEGHQKFVEEFNQDEGLLNTLKVIWGSSFGVPYDGLFRFKLEFFTETNLFVDANEKVDNSIIEKDIEFCVNLLEQGKGIHTLFKVGKLKEVDRLEEKSQDKVVVFKQNQNGNKSEQNVAKVTNRYVQQLFSKVFARLDAALKSGNVEFVQEQYAKLQVASVAFTEVIVEKAENQHGKNTFNDINHPFVNFLDKSLGKLPENINKNKSEEDLRQCKLFCSLFESGGLASETRSFYQQGEQPSQDSQPLNIQLEKINLGEMSNQHFVPSDEESSKNSIDMS